MPHTRLHGGMPKRTVKAMHTMPHTRLHGHLSPHGFLTLEGATVWGGP